MGVVSVNEITGRDYLGSEDLSRKNTRKYRIICDIPNMREDLLAAAAGMPAILAPHPQLSGLRCTGVRIVQEESDNAFIWIATVNWSTLTIRSGGKAANQHSDPGQRSEDPLQRPAIMSFGSERFQRTMNDEDYDGKDIANSAGDPFEAGVVRDDFRATLTISKNVPTFSIQEWFQATNSINRTTWLGFAPATVRIANIAATESFENEKHFFAKTVTFHFAACFEGTWFTRVRDCGYQFVTLQGNRFPILLPDGSKPSTPQRLDGNGSVLGAGGVTKYQSFRLYKYYEFNALDIP